MALSAILRIGDTSAQDVSLTSSGVSILAQPWLNTPDVDQQALDHLGDGNGLSVPAWSNVTESIELHIADSTAAAVAVKVQAIERLLNVARQGTLGWLDDRLYLRLQFDHDSTAWRSQILAAKLELPEGTNQIWRKYVRATLILTRRYFFETEAMQSLEVTSFTTTTPTTGYATLHNNDDGNPSQRNWWQVAAAQVQGSIPAPAKIYIKNSSGATRQASTLFIGNYVFCDPTNLDPVFRTEQSAGNPGTASTAGSDFVWWDIGGTSLLDGFRGQFGRILAVWNDRPVVDTLVRAKIQYDFSSSRVDLAIGDQVLNPAAHYVTDLGALPIPPGRTWQNTDNLLLTLHGTAASSTDTISVDWVQVFPTGAGRYRMLKSIAGSMTVAAGDEIVDDGPNEEVYALTGSTRFPVYQPFFTPIYLWPNKVNRLRVIISSNAFAFEAGEAWQAKLEMRFRRLSF